MFLDVYGNARVTEKTAAYVKETSTELIRLVTDRSGRLSSITDFSGMRFRERDDLEFVFKFWRGKGLFLMDEMREERLRAWYGARYDSRTNLADWDYHMNLSKKASIVHVREFEKWRLDGNAFHVSEGSGNNKTMANRTFATVNGLLQV